MVRHKSLVAVAFLLLLSASLSAATEKDRVLDNFFSTAREIQTGSIPSIESIEADFNSEITFSHETMTALQPFISNIFHAPLPSILRSDGFLRIKFRNVAGKNATENAFLYSNSSLGSFVLTKSGDNIELHVPKLGVIINDSMDEIRNTLPQQNQASVPDANATFPADFLTSILAYITGNEKEIREKIRMEEKTGLLNGMKTYLFTYPLENGNLDIAIYDNFWTFATIGFTGNNTRMQLKYPKPVQKADPSICLPEVVNIKGERDRNLISVELSKLRYNRLFSESDFRVERLNFREFVAIMYLKFIQAR